MLNYENVLRDKSCITSIGFCTKTVISETVIVPVQQVNTWLEKVNFGFLNKNYSFWCAIPCC